MMTGSFRQPFGRVARVATLLLLLLLAVSCGQAADSDVPEGHIPPLLVTGDVDRVLRLDRASWGDYPWESLTVEGETLPALPLEALVETADPWEADYRRVYLVGGDGLTAELDGFDLAGCTVAFSSEFGWQCIAQNHPVSANIKMLGSILVESPNRDRGVSILADDARNGSFYTPAALTRYAPLQVSAFEGTSEMDGHTVSVYTPHLRQPFELSTEGGVCLVRRDGGMAFYRQTEDLFWEVAGNRLDLVSGEQVVRDVAGLVLDPPVARITDVYEDALHLLEQGRRVLILELDGWGVEMERQASSGSNGHPYLSTLPKQQALACYPTISSVGLASMLTGTTPDIHGITTREQRQFAGEDLFASATALGRRCVYVEGDSALIDTSLAPILSVDLGGVAGTDDEVYANAVAALADAPDLAFVHFHGIDDMATERGPYGAFAKTREIDGYVQALVESWQGSVILTADHGLQETPEGTGTHGGLSTAELLVPYCIVEGGVASE